MATNTKNFNFKKPDESDFYSIQDQNGNWDLADEELQKLNEPAFEDYTTGTSVPPAATALEALKSKIKLPVWMSNVVAFCKGCCTLAMIVNNCVSSDADKPLAAAQGKALQDQLTKLYSDLRNVDAVVKGSLLDYAKNVNTFENVNTGDPTTDIPDSARYCIAHIMCRANSWFISVEGRDNRLYMNYNNGTDWTGWNSTALKSDLDNKIQCGLSSIGEISPGESTSEITFPHSFPTAPKSVVGNIRYVGYGDSLSMQIAGITTTGFSVYIHNTSSRKVSIAIYWIACLN